MAEKKKKRSSAKTLQTAREAGYFGKKMLESTLSAAKEGRPTAWSMYDWWEGSVIARAMGIEVVFPENYGAFCAAVGAAEGYLDYCESDGFPATLCGYARNCLGYTRKLKENNFNIPADAPGGGMPKPVFLLACGAGCDARFKWFQALGRYMDVPVWMLETPQPLTKEYFLEGYNEKNIKFMVKELREFVAFLERLMGKKMDWDNLSERLDTMLKTHELAYKVDLLRMAVPSPMLSPDFWAVMVPHMYLPDDKEALAFYQRVYEEVKYKVDHKLGAIPNEKYRLMFAELPPWHTLAFFDEIAERHGIASVIESSGYHVPPPLPEESRQGVTDPLELIALYTYHKFTIPVQFSKEFDTEPPLPYFQWAKDYRVDGFMCHPLISCRAATYPLMHIRNLLMEKFKVPSVIVEGDIVDLRVFNEEEAHTKMGAFIETMDYHRELRKKEGLEW
ncbi:MAG: 2-hydroxyacyl-CoA dehydratase family protein [Firmicutes bacterium]|nr:2-hydroxyacyl-CoA dehydratase family protein [Bacillota bacterium]